LPGPGGDSDEAYRSQQSDGEFYCCDLDEFAKSKGYVIARSMFLSILKRGVLCNV